MVFRCFLRHGISSLNSSNNRVNAEQGPPVPVLGRMRLDMSSGLPVTNPQTTAQFLTSPPRSPCKSDARQSPSPFCKSDAYSAIKQFCKSVTTPTPISSRFQTSHALESDRTRARTVLSFLSFHGRPQLVGSNDNLHQTARVHQPSRWRGDYVAVPRTCAAAGDAAGRVSQRPMRVVGIVIAGVRKPAQ